MARPRVHTGPYGRQEAYRVRQQVRRDALTAYRESVTRAFERAGCHPILDHMPEEPEAWLREAARRMDEVKLVPYAMRTQTMQATLEFEAPEKTLPDRLRFSGETFEAQFDAARLGAQQRRVYTCMRDGRWLTLREIAGETGDPEASVSARVRQLRLYGFTVLRRRRGEPKAGLWEYRMEAAR